MTTLNARANQAYHELLKEQGGDGALVFRESFEEGYEAGYKAKAAELPTQEQIAEAIHNSRPGIHSWKSETCDERAQATRLREAAAVLALLNGGVTTDE